MPPPRYRADALAPSLQIPPVHPVIDERLAGAVTEQHCDGREMCRCDRVDRRPARPRSHQGRAVLRVANAGPSSTTAQPSRLG